jgi:hypothetical protein
MVEAILFSPEFNERRGKWVDASYGICGPNILDTMDIQSLGNADQRLRILEIANRTRFERTDPTIVPDGTDLKFIYECFMQSELQAFSQLWIMGLYEMLRRLGENIGAKRDKTDGITRFPKPFDHCEKLFWDLEVLRMPLAKHQAKDLKGPSSKQKEPHSAELMFNPDTGSMAWAVYCPKRQQRIELVRQEISDEFLRIALIVRDERKAI